MSDLKDPRVLFAAERTQLAWVRASLGLIAFGFVIERSGLLLTELTPSTVGPGTAIRTFWIGLAFIALGIFTDIYSSRQYLVVLKTLNPLEIPNGYGTKGCVVVSWIVALLGVALALGLYFNRA